MKCSCKHYNRRWRMQLVCGLPATVRRAGAPFCGRCDPEAPSFTSEPIPGVQSPFYAGERYIADAELARRVRAEGGQVTP